MEEGYEVRGLDEAAVMRRREVDGVHDPRQDGTQIPGCSVTPEVRQVAAMPVVLLQLVSDDERRLVGVVRIVIHPFQQVLEDYVMGRIAPGVSGLLRRDVEPA